jgi:hypothetical protein
MASSAGLLGLPLERRSIGAATITMKTHETELLVLTQKSEAIKEKELESIFEMNN